MHPLNDYKMNMIDREKEQELYDLVMTDPCSAKYRVYLQTLYDLGRIDEIRRFINLELEAELNVNLVLRPDYLEMTGKAFGVSYSWAYVELLRNRDEQFFKDLCAEVLATEKITTDVVIGRMNRVNKKKVKK